MIIIDHDMDAIFELAEQITVLREGSVLVEGTPEEIKGKRRGPGSLSRRSARAMSLLEVKGLNSYYGNSHILFDVDLRVEKNEVVALLGRNGAGKSTTLKSLMGMVTPRSGEVILDGQNLAGQPPHRIAQAGIQLVPEDRRIFGSLNVEENIILAGLTASRPMAARPHLCDVPPAEGSGAEAGAPICPAASSRCWRSRGPWYGIQRSSCWMNRSRVSRR